MIIKTEQTPEGDYEPQGWLKTTITTGSGTMSASFGAGEPEDFSLGRDLNDAFKIKDMLEMAYQAGRKGELLEFEHINLEK